jgi:hypothetical protein
MRLSGKKHEKQQLIIKDADLWMIFIN